MEKGDDLMQANLAKKDYKGKSFEIIDGQVYMMSPVRFTHAIVAGNIYRIFSNYLKGKKYTDNVCLNAFKEWWTGINSCHRVRILGQEKSLICEYFAGTYDLLITIDDKPYLIDFKTSNHVGYKYFMQLAAYRYLLYTQKNINIEGCIILQFDKTEPKYREFNLNFSDPYDYEFIENCHRSFMGLVYTYYNTKLCQRQFGQLF